MKNEKLLDTLKDIGLDETEAQVYLASLSLGPTTVLRIARVSEIKRTTVYGVIESLKNKGLMRIEPKGLKQLYVAENPENLETILDKRKREFSAKLPDFMALYKLEGGESSIKYYTGLKAMKRIYLGTLDDVKRGGEYLVITNEEKWFELDPDFWMKEYIEERAKLPCKTRLISQNSNIAQEHHKFQKNYNEEFKIFTSDVSLNIDMVLVPDKLIIVDLLPPLTTLVIENKNIIELQKQLFEIIWRSLPE
ncbi:MAG: helix-turn-helix domain-containing protein [Patescibacteria group bacterium]